ncbi:MAG TPA: hypothetical protein ENN76_01325, partial [Euryarchaeota archaeon]|nr:hypothetical protein [Euryarchaeota archaeon]
DVEIFDIDVSRSTCGVLMGFSNLVTVWNVTSSNSTLGLLAVSCSMVHVHNSTFKHNTQTATLIQNSNSCKISHCSYHFNREGVYFLSTSESSITNIFGTSSTLYIVRIQHGSKNIVSDNVMEHSGTGIRLQQTYYNTLKFNLVRNNYNGVYASNSDKNLFVSNAFLDCVNPAVDFGINIYDDGYSRGGNYWSDHTGMDVYHGVYQDLRGSDGIVDVRRKINKETADRYPLKYSPFDDAPAFTLALFPGWNLVSVPVIEYPVSVEEFFQPVLDHILTVQCYRDGEWLSWDYRNPPWLNNLLYMDYSMGIWVRVNSSTPLELPLWLPVVIGVEIQMKKGWNLVGLPIEESGMTLSRVFAGVPWDIIQGFDADRPYMLRTLPGTKETRPGEGYWIHVTQDCVWSP